MNRTAMKAGSTLLLRNSESGETVRLEIISEALGRGSSCIVYEAKALGQKLACKYRLKELYPKDIHGIYRDSSNELIINEDSYDKYNAAKDRFERSLDLLWDFAYSDETGNYTVCPLGKFEGVSDSKCPALYLITQWMPSDYISSVSLCSRSDISNIETAVKICLKTTYAAMQFHKMGYINLDIKPENILYSPRTDTISFFDTDTIFHKDIPPSEPISFSQGAAPEIINGFASLYSEKIDVFAIGAMLHRFITGENYAAGQYSLDIPERRNAICKCRSLKYASPEVSDMIVHILECCCKGNPTKRISTEELASMLEQLVLLLSPESTEKSSCNNDEINIFLNNTNKLYKTNKMIRRIYVTAFCLFTGVLLITAFFGKAFSVHSIVVSIVCIFMMLLLRSMIFKRSAEIAINRICMQNCLDNNFNNTNNSNNYYKNYKAAFEFAGLPNNRQTFEISTPEFVSSIENKRHRTRIFLGTGALISGLISAVISFTLNSFPFLVAVCSVILLVVFCADYIYSLKITNEMYNLKFGSDPRGNKRKINEIYFYGKTCSENKPSSMLSIDCIKQILYNEYKIRCNMWGIADVSAKSLAGINIFILILETISFPVSDYFKITGVLSDSTLFCVGIILYIIISFVMIALCPSFYAGTKDVLFTIYSENEADLMDKHSEYSEKSNCYRVAYARGIYAYALMRLEQGIPIYELSEYERPTFSQYCISQNARTNTYYFLLLIAAVSIVVWHFSLYLMIIPILFFGTAFQMWWFRSGVYKFNKLFLKFKPI